MELGKEKLWVGAMRPGARLLVTKPDKQATGSCDSEVFGSRESDDRRNEGGKLGLIT